MRNVFVSYSHRLDQSDADDLEENLEIQEWYFQTDRWKI